MSTAMDKHNNFKKNIWLGMCASSFTAACALLLALSFFRPHSILFKILPEAASFLDKIVIGNYLFFFFFLILLIPCLFVSFVFRKPLKVFQAQLFSFWTVISLSFASSIYSEKIAMAASRNLLLSIFFISLSLAAILIYNRIYRMKDLKRLILVTLAGVIVLSLSSFIFDFNRWLLPFLTKRYILSGLGVAALVGLVIISGWFFIYRLLVWIVDKIIYFTAKGKASVFAQFLLVFLAVSFSISISSYLWQNRQNPTFYKRIASRAAKDTNVILIIIDALRADHLGCYGYGRQTSPVIDSFAKEGVLFKHCYSATSYTKSSVASMMTSLHESIHGMTREHHVLPESLTTLAEILRENGYITSAYVANPLVTAKYNYDQGFDFFQDDQPPGDSKLYLTAYKLFENLMLKFIWLAKEDFRFPQIDGKKIGNVKAISWLAKFRRRNFFMLIHYMGCHYPYCPPKPYDEIFPYAAGNETLQKISLYDGEIRFVNEYLDEIFEKLKSWKIYDNTLIIVTADHGEAFGEHGFYDHTNTLYQEEIKVPLIIKLDHSLPQGKVIERQVGSIDIMPTILDALGISYAGSLEGKSLLPLIINDKEDRSRDYIFVEKDNNEPFKKAIIKNNEWKLIFTKDKSTSGDIMRKEDLELYNLKADPGESRNLVSEEPQILNELLAEMQRYIKYCQTKALSPAEIEPDSETTQQLKALGYVQ